MEQWQWEVVKIGVVYGSVFGLVLYGDKNWLIGYPWWLSKLDKGWITGFW